MVLRYIGTAATEGVPAVFCGCDTCRRARAAGGRNIRMRSQALVDGKLLLDFPADTAAHFFSGVLPLNDIHHLLITHRHGDHFYPTEFGNMRENFCHPANDIPLTIYASKTAGESVIRELESANLVNLGRAVYKEAVPFEPFKIENYTVTALPADHDPTSGPLVYLISDGEKTMLYAHDSGYFPDGTWDYLEKTRPYLNMLSIDCTEGAVLKRRDHMCLETDREVCARMRESGIIDDKTLIYLNHFSHNGLKTYDEMVPLAAEYGFNVSYDGCVVEF